MLQIEHVTKKYNNHLALQDINLELGHGVYGLLAPNGAGKTTLMKMITTLLFPTEGRIIYDGTEIQKLDTSYREKIGFLPQDFGFYKEYSPEKYLQYVGILKGIPREKLKVNIAWVLDMVGLAEERYKKMKNFSGGMIQRVGIAQALLNDPQILVLDEPTAGLDPKERVRFRKILTSLSKDKTVLISTHIVSDVEFIANHIIMIKDRKIYCNDTVEAICSRLQGKIFETSIDAGSLPEWERQYQIVSQRQEGSSVAIRFISPEGAGGEWKSSQPGLEDVFLYTYQNEK